MKISSAISALLLVASCEPSVALLNMFKKQSTAPAAAKPAPPTSGPRLPATILDNKGLDHLFEKNKQWIKKKKSQDSRFFQKLGSTHTPQYMYIGCVDARVPPESIMGEDAGNVFVHRNVANMVVNNDVNLLSAIQYGVAYLKVQDIIVCGHYECGGVRAAENNYDHIEPLEQWLRNVRDVYRLHKEELDAIQDADARHRRLVDLNVIEQCINVFKTGVVQKRRLETYKDGSPFMMPRVHAMVFDPKSGDLKRIPFNFEEYAKDLSDIYGMYVLP